MEPYIWQRQKLYITAQNAVTKRPSGREDVPRAVPGILLLSILKNLQHLAERSQRAALLRMAGTAVPGIPIEIYLPA